MLLFFPYSFMMLPLIFALDVKVLLFTILTRFLPARCLIDIIFNFL